MEKGYHFPTMASDNPLIDFSRDKELEWFIVNDGVMGGRSRSNLRVTDEGTGLFAGVLSLENGGGFASVRLVMGSTDLSRYAGLELEVRGDGRMYQLRLRTDDRFDGVAYRALFDTREGEWLTVHLPFDDFQPVFRGQVLEDRDPLDPAAVHQVALMLADKQAGPFSLEVRRLSAWK